MDRGFLNPLFYKEPAILVSPTFSENLSCLNTNLPNFVCLVFFGDHAIVTQLMCSNDGARIAERYYLVTEASSCMVYEISCQVL